jgi:hypothetical protein
MFIYLFIGRSIDEAKAFPRRAGYMVDVITVGAARSFFTINADMGGSGDSVFLRHKQKA